MVLFATYTLTIIYLIPCMIYSLLFSVSTCNRLWKSIQNPKHLIIAVVEYFCIFFIITSGIAWTYSCFPTLFSAINLSDIKIISPLLITFVAIAAGINVLKSIIEHKDIQIKEICLLLSKFILTSAIIIIATAIFILIAQYIFYYERKIYEMLWSGPYSTFSDYAYSVIGLLVIPICTIMIPNIINKYIELAIPPTDNKASVNRIIFNNKG